MPTREIEESGVVPDLIAGLFERSLPLTTFPRRLKSAKLGEEIIEFDGATVTFIEGRLELEVTFEGQEFDDNDLENYKQLSKFELSATTNEGEVLVADNLVLVSYSSSANFHGVYKKVKWISSKWMLGGNNAVLWIGNYFGELPFAPAGNLKIRIKYPDRELHSGYHFALTGIKNTYYLLSTKKEVGSNTIAIETFSQDFNFEEVHREVSALGFVTGRVIACKFLLGLDERGNIVGYTGGDFGYPALNPNFSASPIPETYRDNLFPVFFQKICVAMAQNLHQSLFLREAVRLYVEALAERSLTSIQMKALLTLLAAARLHIDQDQILVKDFEQWKSWLSSVSETINDFATPEFANVLYDKIVSSPFPDRVELIRMAVESLELVLPQEIIDAIVKACHPLELVLTSDNYLDQFAKLRTLAVALISKFIGYQGPISGWIKLEHFPGYKPTDSWWSIDKIEYPKSIFLGANANVSLDITELWPIFDPPVLPSEGLIGEINKFASSLLNRTRGIVRARIIPLDFADEESVKSFDFILETATVNPISSILFSFSELSDKSILILGWEDDSIVIQTEDELILFLKSVAISPKTRSSVERLIISSGYTKEYEQ